PPGAAHHSGRDQADRQVRRLGAGSPGPALHHGRPGEVRGVAAQPLSARQNIVCYCWGMAGRRRLKRTYRVFRLDTWDQFLQLVTHPPYSNWAFRGERDERWPLYSSLSRYLRAFGVHPQAWPEQEDRIL